MQKVINDFKEDISISFDSLEEDIKEIKAMVGDICIIET